MDRPAIWQAADGGDLDELRRCIGRGDDLAAVGPRGQTALHAATERGHIEVVKALLNAGAGMKRRDARGQAPLGIAISYGRDEIFRLLLSRGADPDGAPGVSLSPLATAAQTGRLNMLRALLLAGANIDPGVLTAAVSASRNSSSTVEVLIKRGAPLDAADMNERQPLHCAIYNPGVLRRLIFAGAPLEGRDKEGNTPLLLAINTTAEESAWILLEAGADPFVVANNGVGVIHRLATREPGKLLEAVLERGVEVEAADRHGRTALMIAAEIGRMETLDRLLEAGADIQRLDTNGSSALIGAVRAGQEVMALHLLELGASAEPRPYGRSALHFACARKGISIELIEALLAAGLKPNETGPKGRSCLELAAEQGRPELVACLEASSDKSPEASLEAHLFEAIDRGQPLWLERDLSHARPDLELLVRAWMRILDRSQRDRAALARALLSSGLGVDTEIEGLSLAMWTMVRGCLDIDIAEALLEAGADATESHPTHGSLLHLVAGGADALGWDDRPRHRSRDELDELYRLAELLAEAKAPMEALDSLGRGPLEWAAERRDEAMVRLLLGRGGAIDGCPNDGRRALHLAAGRNESGIVELLLEAGVDVTATDAEGQTALDHALRCSWTGVASLIEKKESADF